METTPPGYRTRIIWPLWPMILMEVNPSVTESESYDICGQWFWSLANYNHQFTANNSLTISNTPPQDGVYISLIPILHTIVEVLRLRPLVKTSASWCFWLDKGYAQLTISQLLLDEVPLNLNMLCSHMLYRIMGNVDRSFICHNTRRGVCSPLTQFRMTSFCHKSTQTFSALALYSTSVVDLATTNCFL